MAQDSPGNVTVGLLPDSLLHSISQVSTDMAVGASAGLEDIMRLGLILPFMYGGIEATTEINIEALFDMKLLHVQIGVQTTGTGGDNTLDVEVDGSSVLSAAQVTALTVANTDADGTVGTTVLDIDVAKGSIITLVVTLATAAAGLAPALITQRTGRPGGVGTV